MRNFFKVVLIGSISLSLSNCSQMASYTKTGSALTISGKISDTIDKMWDNTSDKVFSKKDQESKSPKPNKSKNNKNKK